MNDAACPHCSRLIRASHTDNQCYWRCRVTTCPMWFTSELNGKDHLERIHKFQEGQGCSFYECLRKFGLEWFCRRSFFEKRAESGQALWMDLALARQSGQELHNHHVITNSPVMAHLRRFFRAAVRDITTAYEDLAFTCVVADIKLSICDQMRRKIAQAAEDFDPSIDQASGYDIPVGESVPPPTNFATTPPPVVETTRRLLTPNNRALAVLQSGSFVPPQCHMPLTRGAVSSASIASTELQSIIETLPMDQLVCHTPRSIQTAARDEILAVAHRYLTVARRNVAEFTKYLNMHSAHLAACAGAINDTVPLMSAETFPHTSGGIRSALQELRQDQ